MVEITKEYSKLKRIRYTFEESEIQQALIDYISTKIHGVKPLGEAQWIFNWWGDDEEYQLVVELILKLEEPLEST